MIAVTILPAEAQKILRVAVVNPKRRLAAAATILPAEALKTPVVAVATVATILPAEAQKIPVVAAADRNSARGRSCDRSGSAKGWFLDNSESSYSPMLPLWLGSAPRSNPTR